MIVPDVNVIVPLFIDQESATTDVQSLWESDPDWIVPTLWKHEFTNVLWKYVALADETDPLPLEVAREHLRDAESLLETDTREPDFAQVLETAAECSISAYDAEYVWLARTLEVPLVTYDRSLLPLDGVVPPSDLL